MRRVVTPLVAAVLAGGGCGGERQDPVAAAVARGVRDQLGLAVERVRCEPTRCAVTVVGGATLAVTVSAAAGGGREVRWESEEVVVTAAVARWLGAELAELGLDVAVDCGPPLVAAAPGTSTRVTCALGGGGAAWVDVAADGGLAVELALDARIARARTEDVDVAGLDELSRALDTAEARADGEGEADDDEGAPGAEKGI